MKLEKRCGYLLSCCESVTLGMISIFPLLVISIIQITFHDYFFSLLLFSLSTFLFQSRVLSLVFVPGGCLFFQFLLINIHKKHLPDTDQTITSQNFGHDFILIKIF